MTANPKGRDAPLSQRRLRLWLRMLRTTRTVESQLRDFLREEFDTTLPRFDVMAALFQSSDGLKMSALSKRLLVSNGNVTGIVDRLEHDGLAERVSVAGDRRASLVRLTDVGEQRFQEMAARHRAVVDEIFAPLDHDRLDSLAEAFGRLKDEGEGNP